MEGTSASPTTTRPVGVGRTTLQWYSTARYEQTDRQTSKGKRRKMSEVRRDDDERLSHTRQDE